MTKIKICGIRRKEDVLLVNRCLPEYIGFVFAESRRRVSPKLAKMLKENLDTRIKTAGVFVNEDISLAIEVTYECELDVIQLHGTETADYVHQLRERLSGQGRNVELWKAVKVSCREDLKEMDKYAADAFVLDTCSDGKFGGTGTPFDWHMAEAAGMHRKIILAGGLMPANVREAAGIVLPYAVDVSSGVETDGYKDEIRIRDFIYALRNDGIM